MAALRALKKGVRRRRALLEFTVQRVARLTPLLHSELDLERGGWWMRVRSSGFGSALVEVKDAAMAHAFAAS